MLELPLPAVDCAAVRVLHDGQHSVGGAKAQQVPQEVWEALEAALQANLEASCGAWPEGECLVPGFTEGKARGSKCVVRPVAQRHCSEPSPAAAALHAAPLEPSFCSFMNLQVAAVHAWRRTSLLAAAAVWARPWCCKWS